MQDISISLEQPKLQLADAHTTQKLPSANLPTVRLLGPTASPSQAAAYGWFCWRLTLAFLALMIALPLVVGMPCAALTALT